MDEMALVKELGVVADPSETTLRSARNALLQVTETAGDRRWPAGRVMAAAAAFVVFSGAAVVARVELSTGSPSTNTTIECGEDTYIPTASGNPIADCAAAIARSGERVPILVGWITPSGLVAVLPSRVPPPAGSTRLPTGFQVDAAVRYVTNSLSDQTGPLQTSCLSPVGASALATQQLRLAGLADWRVRVQGNTTSSCAAYASVIDSSSSSVVLYGFATTPGSASSDPTGRLDDLLRSQLSSRCDSEQQATALVTTDAQELGIGPAALAMSVGGGIGTGTRCAVAFVDPGGTVDVVIWAAGRAS